MARASSTAPPRHAVCRACSGCTTGAASRCWDTLSPATPPRLKGNESRRGATCGWRRRGSTTPTWRAAWPPTRCTCWWTRRATRCGRRRKPWCSRRRLSSSPSTASRAPWAPPSCTTSPPTPAPPLQTTRASTRRGWGWCHGPTSSTTTASRAARCWRRRRTQGCPRARSWASARATWCSRASTRCTRSSPRCSRRGCRCWRACRAPGCGCSSSAPRRRSCCGRRRRGAACSRRGWSSTTSSRTTRSCWPRPTRTSSSTRRSSTPTPLAATCSGPEYPCSHSPATTLPSAWRRGWCTPRGCWTSRARAPSTTTWRWPSSCAGGGGCCGGCGGGCARRGRRSRSSTRACSPPTWSDPWRPCGRSTLRGSSPCTSSSPPKAASPCHPDACASHALFLEQ
mmetsp:Transcript_18506/g.51115  ORF Transcript_18506/g.51115 Transcript_18506/m.51115 type:complete len:397 (+) Transcript_18506:983-2173(+)